MNDTNKPTARAGGIEFFGDAELASEAAPTKSSVRSLETYFVLVAGGWIGRVAMDPSATWQQAATCIGLALLVGSFTIGRSIVKRSAR